MTKLLISMMLGLALATTAYAGGEPAKPAKTEKSADKAKKECKEVKDEKTGKTKVKCTYPKKAEKK